MNFECKKVSHAELITNLYNNDITVITRSDSVWDYNVLCMNPDRQGSKPILWKFFQIQNGVFLITHYYSYTLALCLNIIKLFGINIYNTDTLAVLQWISIGCDNLSRSDIGYYLLDPLTEWMDLKYYYQFKIIGWIPKKWIICPWTSIEHPHLQENH